jgi:hypothetical protein
VCVCSVSECACVRVCACVLGRPFAFTCWDKSPAGDTRTEGSLFGLNKEVYNQ